MSDVVLVALITAISTLTSGPLIHLINERRESKKQDKLDKDKQLNDIQVFLDDILKLRDTFHKEVSIIELRYREGIHSPFSDQGEENNDVLHTFAIGMQRAITTLSFQLKDPQLRKYLAHFETSWETALTKLNVSDFYANDDNNGRYITCIIEITTTHLEPMNKQFMHSTQQVLIDHKAK